MVVWTPAVLMSYMHVFCIFYLHLFSAIELVSRGKAF